ncbi:unnamed protein product [Lupinus luteus]|uniref:Glycosyl transferase CAP10 domain-containing protein n=1 Tax=Lupinus luteus TaxID=3873 RepID=A0AAV1WYY0_LUPLU
MQTFLQQRSKTQFIAGTLLKKGPAHFAAYTSILLLLIFFSASTVCSIWATLSTADSKHKSTNKTIVAPISRNHNGKRLLQNTLNCTTTGNQTCSTRYPTTSTTFEKNDETCPEYFRWIHEDLRAWKATGITRDMVERASTTAHFRLIVKKGKVYVEKYRKSIQTRDIFTIWGIMQLVKKYEGMVPDLELMFDCDDRPVVLASDYNDHDRNKITGPPPLFRYCGDRWTHDIVFPDWSFWGWAEINIRPWEYVLNDIKEGNKRIKWKDREPFAYWKGNPAVDETRKDLLKCNVSDAHDWNARLFVQDWEKESEQGYKNSNVANQCTYRHKIYIEGYAWSVSEKYILGCDSVTLLVTPRFHDFFIRSLQPLQHYWPIKDSDKCHSIQHAVEWGNNHTQKAQEIGRAASKFIQEDLNMDHVYDYMFHLLNEYAKLLKFEPTVPEGAVELCSEAMACTRNGTEKKFMSESFVGGPSIKAPCSLPHPFEPNTLRLFYANKLNVIKRIEKWEDEYWSQN